MYICILRNLTTDTLYVCMYVRMYMYVSLSLSMYLCVYVCIAELARDAADGAETSNQTSALVEILTLDLSIFALDERYSDPECSWRLNLNYTAVRRDVRTLIRNHRYAGSSSV